MAHRLHAADDAADLELRLLVRAESAGFALYGQRDPATVLRLLDDAERIAAVPLGVAGRPEQQPGQGAVPARPA